MAPPKRGEDYYWLPPPSESTRLWAMTFIGIVTLLTALVLMIAVTFEMIDKDREWEEISTLLIVGVTFLWFGSPRQVEPSQFDPTQRAIRRHQPKGPQMERMQHEKAD
jgi:hypothetical protein